jgi:hypothetical protein
MKHVFTSSVSTHFSFAFACTSVFRPPIRCISECFMSTIFTHHNASPAKYAEVSNETIEMSSLRANSELLSSTKLYENNLPPYDKAVGTRKRCLLGLSLSYALSVTLIICGIVSYVFAAKARNKAIAIRLSYPVPEGEDASYGIIDEAEMYYPTIRDYHPGLQRHRNGGH